MCLAAVLGLGADVVRHVVPVPEAVERDAFEQQALLVGAPLGIEERSVHRLDHAIAVIVSVFRDVDSAAEAADTKVEIRAVGAANADFICDVLLLELKC